ATGEREGSVREFWGLPSAIPSLSPKPQTGSSGEGEGEQTGWRERVFVEICAITSAVFEAAARVSSTHFQPLPNSFEVFGVDFLVDAGGGVWLLEVNAFPDFGQTGEELRGVVRGLVEGVVEVGVQPFFGLGEGEEGEVGAGEMIKVLDIDLGRR
ncbi:putative tubulin--tyrosine ligase pby1, partial [Friedmanniomyces endolithicus]